MPNDRPTLEDIRIVWRDVSVLAYALPKKDWFDRLDAAIRADERLLVSAEKDVEIARLTREVEEMRGVIETYGRVENRRSMSLDALELRFMVSADVLRAGGIGVFDAAMRECREQWHAWIKEDRERSMSVQERLPATLLIRWPTTHERKERRSMMSSDKPDPAASRAERGAEDARTPLPDDALFCSKCQGHGWYFENDPLHERQRALLAARSASRPEEPKNG